MNTAEKIGLLPGFGWIADHSWLVTLLICWMITPIGHLVVGVIGESRFIPLSPNKQFSSFFPGDLFLGLMTMGLLMLAQRLPAQQGFYNQWWWHVIILLAALVVASIMTYGEWKSGFYPPRAILSPSKLYHNFLLYGGYGYVIVTTLFALLAANRNWWLLAALLPGLIWVGLIVIDGNQSKEIQQNRARNAHVEDWRPIWSHH